MNIFSLKFRSDKGYSYSILTLCNTVDEAIEKAQIRSKLTNDEIVSVHQKFISLRDSR